METYFWETHKGVLSSNLKSGVFDKRMFIDNLIFVREKGLPHFLPGICEFNNIKSCTVNLTGIKFKEISTFMAPTHYFVAHKRG